MKAVDSLAAAPRADVSGTSGGVREYEQPVTSLLSTPKTTLTSEIFVLIISLGPELPSA